MIALTLRLDDDMHEALRQEAFDRRVSVNQIIRERIAAPEPQGEPSDAQVEAAWAVIERDGLTVLERSHIRAALRAASAVTEQGERNGRV